MSDAHLYTELAAFDHFVDDAFEPIHYVTVPDDWLILVADIESSTAAVANGRYNDVNYVGAACVAAFNQLLPSNAVATVFGGDGASALVPGAARTDAVETLRSLRRWAKKQFSLELRIGLVPVADLKCLGGSLSLGKMRLSPGNFVAMFRGDGLDIADTLVKLDPDGQYRIVVDSHYDTLPPPKLDDLSCRWSPMPSQHGVMLCLIIGISPSLFPTDAERDRCYADIVRQIDAIVTLEDPRSNPVKLSELNFQLRWRTIKNEVKSRFGSLPARVCKVLLVHLIARVLFFTSWKSGNFDPKKYRSEIPLNCDFIKVSGMVRMLLDCSAAQAAQIEIVLEAAYNSGDIVYGIHHADKAIMTCITPDINNARHLHHIDGSNGGFWAAASDLKRRLATQE